VSLPNGIEKEADKIGDNYECGKEDHEDRDKRVDEEQINSIDKFMCQIADDVVIEMTS
jgi:hypothetical protein